MRRSLRARVLRPQRLDPGGGEGHLARPARVVEHADVGGADLAVQLGREAVRRDVDHPVAGGGRRGDGLGERRVDPAPVREVVRLEQAPPLRLAQMPGRLGMQVGRADRAVQVGEEPRRLVVVERRAEALRHLARQQQRPGIPAAMGRQQMLVADEERRVLLAARRCRHARR